MVDGEIIAYFNKLYDRTYRKVAIYATSKCGSTSDIEDIIQETYTESYCVLIRKGIHYINNPEAFVIKVCKRKIANYYSLKSKIKNTFGILAKDTETDHYLDIDTENYSLENKVITKQMAEEIWTTISSKDLVTQKIFRLFYIYDLTLAEISKLLSMNESNVKNKLYRTLKEIRKVYGQEG